MAAFIVAGLLSTMAGFGVGEVINIRTSRSFNLQGGGSRRKKGHTKQYLRKVRRQKKKNLQTKRVIPSLKNRSMHRQYYSLGSSPLSAGHSVVPDTHFKTNHKAPATTQNTRFNTFRQFDDVLKLASHDVILGGMNLDAVMPLSAFSITSEPNSYINIEKPLSDQKMLEHRPVENKSLSHVTVESTSTTRDMTNEMLRFVAGGQSTTIKTHLTGGQYPVSHMFETTLSNPDFVVAPKATFAGGSTPIDSAMDLDTYGEDKSENMSTISTFSYGWL